MRSEYQEVNMRQERQRNDTLSKALWSWQFMQLWLIQTIVLVFPFMLLGGFKMPVLMAVPADRYLLTDWSLTVLGSAGALLIFVSRFAT